MTFIYFVLCATFFVDINAAGFQYFDPRIAGGEKSPIESYPYMVSIRDGEITTRCSASIISRDHILTAAHCIPDDFQRLKIRAGSNFERLEGTVHSVESFYRHENYTIEYWGNGTVTSNDIAVVKITPPFVFNAACQPISLFDSDEKVESGSKAVVSGWGHVPRKQTFYWSILDKSFMPLQSVVVPVFDTRICAKEFAKKHYVLKAGQICAGGNGRGSCKGDSGAPLVVNGRQVGIVSWGYGCGLYNYPPTIYTEVAYFRKWIDEKMRRLVSYSYSNFDDFVEPERIWV